MPFLSAELLRDLIANRPAAGSAGRIFFSADEGKTYRDNGTSWEDCSDTGAVASVAGKTGAVTLAESDISGLTTDLAAKAPLASPTFTGTPAAPTPLTSDNSTTLATTAWVKNQGYGTSSGTVTSVGLSTPSWLTVSGTPVTTSGTLAVTAATGQTANRFLATPDGSTGTVGLRAIVAADLPPAPYDIPSFLTGKPGASATVLKVIFARHVDFSADFAGAYGAVGANPTATASYTINKNGSSTGTISISTSGVFTFTSSGGAAVSFSAGDILTVTAPSSQDATLSDVAFTLSGTR